MNKEINFMDNEKITGDAVIKRGYDIYDEWLEKKPSSRKIVDSVNSAVRAVKENKTNLILSIWNTIGSVIIAGFFLFGFIICGTAALGYCEANTYFVGNHGEYTQVSEIIYHVSYVWEILFWIFIPLTPLGCFLISHIQGKMEQKKKRLE